MCGICGILRFDGNPPPPDLVTEMCRRLQHRGPDDGGQWRGKGIELGHRRLAIVDVSANGHQPMPNEDESIWLTFNGEIYNQAELRTELQALGHRFRSQADTEVIVHAYEEWGYRCLDRLNGMFAFGLWDVAQSRLWLARDRIGIKPLFIAKTEEALLFASEIKALLAYAGLPRDLDKKALAYHLSFNWIPAPHTMFRAIRQVLPGHHLTISGAGELQDVSYWECTDEESPALDEDEWTARFEAAMGKSVRLRLMSDVPLGLFLSGGQDSTAVLRWMKRHVIGRPKAFTIGFHDQSYDETQHAMGVAAHMQADHFIETLDLDATICLPELIYHAEEPTADSSMLPMYLLAQHARKHVTAVLSGDGADELLAGYETYAASLLLPSYLSIPSILRRGLFEKLVWMLPVSYRKLSIDNCLKRFVSGARHGPERAHGAWRIIADTPLRQRLLAPAWEDEELRSETLELYDAYFSACPMRKPLNRLLWVDTRLYLPNDMLVKLDRMTMAHGLEARVPFLDHNIVELCFRIPPRLKLRRLFGQKYLLRRCLEGQVPQEVYRRRKAGFSVPVSSWARGPMREFCQDTLSSSALADIGLFDPAAVKDVLEAHARKQVDHGHLIWGMLVFCLWFNRFCKGAV